MLGGLRAALVAASWIGVALGDIFEGDATALIQNAAARRQQALGAELAFEVGQALEVNVYGTKWVNCTIVGPGSKPETFNIHVPSFPSGHQDLPDVKAASLRDPFAEERKKALREAEERRLKDQEQERAKAQEDEKKAREEEEQRVEEQAAHTFVPGESVEVKSTSKNGTLTWVKATVIGPGSYPNKYNISVGGAKIVNINYMALRKDADRHFEAGERAEIRSRGGNATWVKCVITSRGDEPNTYHVHIPTAPEHKRDLLNVPVASLRKEPIPVWTPRFEIGELMEVKLADPQSQSQWTRCNITGKGVKEETYHVQVLGGRAGSFRLENVSSSLLRETQEGLQILREKKARIEAEAEAKRQLEMNNKRREEEEQVRQRYALQKLEEAERAQRDLAEQMREDEEKAKTDPFVFVKVQARKRMEALAESSRDQRRRIEEEMKQREDFEKDVQRQLAQRMEQRFQKSADGDGVLDEEETGVKAFEDYVAAERAKKLEAVKKQVELLASAKEDESAEVDEDARKARMLEARRTADEEKRQKRRDELMEKRRSAALAALSRAVTETWPRSRLVEDLRPAIEEARRSGVELGEFVEPSRVLIWALWNATTDRLKLAVRPGRPDLMELARALAESQENAMEMERLHMLLSLGEAQKKGEAADMSTLPSYQPIADALKDLEDIPHTTSRKALLAALARNYSSPVLDHIDEFAAAEQLFRYEGQKWAAYLHMKEAMKARNTSELRAAAIEAEYANVTQALVREASVVSALWNASQSQDVLQLKRALTMGTDFWGYCNRSNLVSNSTVEAIAMARKALEKEKNKEPVRKELSYAAASRNLTRLEVVLRQAEGMGLHDDELKYSRELRQTLSEEAKSKAKEKAKFEAERRKQQAQAEREKRKASRARKAAEAKEREIKEAQAQRERDVAEFKARKAAEAEEWRKGQEEEAKKKEAERQEKEEAKRAAREKVEKRRREAEERVQKVREAEEEVARKEAEERDRKEKEEKEKLERAEKEEKERAEKEKKHTEADAKRAESAAEFKERAAKLERARKEQEKKARMDARQTNKTAAVAAADGGEARRVAVKDQPATKATDDSFS